MSPRDQNKYKLSNKHRSTKKVPTLSMDTQSRENSPRRFSGQWPVDSFCVVSIDTEAKQPSTLSQFSILTLSLVSINNLLFGSIYQFKTTATLSPLTPSTHRWNAGQWCPSIIRLVNHNLTRLESWNCGLNKPILVLHKRPQLKFEFGFTSPSAIIQNVLSAVDSELTVLADCPGFRGQWN